MDSLKDIRVCYVGSPALFSKGASAIHMMKMCQAMTNLGIEVELLLPSFNKKNDIYGYYAVDKRFKITSIPFTNLIARQITHGIASSFYVWFKKNRFDFVLTRNIVFTYLSTLFFKIPTIYDAHHPPVNSAAKYLFNSFKDSDQLLKFSTNSKGLGEIYLKLGLKSYKHVVAHNGVDIERFNIKSTQEELRNDLGLPLNSKIVCYAGNTYRGRGIELLIDVASRLREVQFLVIGGLEEDNLIYKNLLKEKNVENFIIKGFVDNRDVPMYLKASDILVIPYTSSLTIKGGTKAIGFTSPIKLFEYMASKRPIVATSLPTIKEVLQHNKNSILVEPDSVEALYDGIVSVLGDKVLAKTIAENSASNVLNYTWEERARNILANI